ncbi:MAG TPA: N-acetylglucosamine-6-phosphate deacetylase, partial [Rhodanobacteraceae bacterium]|nr:N-acetylglucosamine-6-phosphate deacetylase [Rhodanobacteraceae bacterium]
MKYLLHNARVLTDFGIEDGLGVLLDGARIAAVAPLRELETTQAERRDLEGMYLAPGFVDTQVNGGGDVLFNDAPCVQTIERIARAHRPFGTTGLLPTLISTDSATMRAAITAVDAAIAQGVPGVLGIHLEGPFLGSARKGVHDPAQFRLPTADELDVVCSLRNGRTILTLAPECVPAEVIRELTARGVLVCAGHTAADYARTRGALDAGLRGFTHLFNAMTPMQSREPGVVGAALEDAESWCGVIVDGHHVHPATLRVGLAAKARGKLMLVTDAMPPVGGASSSFTLDGRRIDCRDGRCTTPDGTLAGSALDMAAAVRNTVGLLGVPLEEALRMASSYPAAFLGLDHELGRIAAGHRADLAVLEADLCVRETWIGGES